MSLTYTHPPILDSASLAGSDINPLSFEAPILAHSLKHDKSILALLVSSSYIFAGTEDGRILVRTISEIICVKGS
jgi:hypothetical protein